MRILVASDLHYRLPHYDWLVGAAEDVDVVALAGDLADVVSPVPHEVQTVVVRKYLDALADRAAVFAASGNHDLDGPGRTASRSPAGCGDLRPRRRCTSTAAASTSATPGSRCVRGGTARSPATRWRRSCAAAAVDRPARWVWLYHAPPAGTPLCNDGRRTFPDQELADWIAELQPDLVFCGHIHQAPWIDGRHLARPAGPHLGLQRRQADRQGAGSHHRRHRRGDRPLVRGLRVGDR